MALTAPDWTRLVVVGCSWGGLEAMGQVLADLPGDADCAVVVAQHRNATPSPLARLWAQQTGWPVIEPEDKEPLRAGHVFIAPPGYHLMVEGAHLALSTEAPHNHSRPSIDVLFDTAATEWGPRVVAVVLTGANSDGAAGAAAVARHSGAVVVQDPAEAVRPEMPEAALRAVPDAVVLPLPAIGAYLGDLSRKPKAFRGNQGAAR